MRAARLAVLVGAALCLAAALAMIPRPDRDALPTRPGVCVAVIDASASASRGRPDWDVWVRGRLRELVDEARHSGMELALIEFAASARTLLPPTSPRAVRELLVGRGGAGYSPRGAGARLSGGADGLDPELGSDLFSALGLARRALAGEGRAPGRVVLLGDGGATGRDPRSALTELAELGATLELVPPPPSVRAGARLTRLLAPAQVEQGARLPFALHVELEGPFRELARAGASLRVELELIGGSATHARELSIPLQPGDPAARELRDAFESVPRGVYALTARAQLLDGGGRPVDPWPEDDTAAIDVRVGDPLSCLVVAQEPELALAALRALPGADEGIDWHAVRPFEVAGELERHDLLWSVDVRTGALPRGEVQAFVRGGGGWIFSSGWDALAPWQRVERLAPDDLQRLLPLEPAPEDAEDRDVIFLVDGSGSMRAPFEDVRQAVLQLVEGARPTDYVSLHFFTQALQEATVSNLAGADPGLADAIEPLLRARVPGGGTDLLYSLAQLVESREKRARKGLVLLLSDGRSAATGADVEALRARLASARLQLHVLAIGESIDFPFLRALLPPERAVVDASDTERLVELLNAAVNAGRVAEEPGQTALLVEEQTLASGSPGHELVRALAAPAGDGADAGRRDLGPVEKYARAELREGADALWVEAGGDVLLAAWRVGRGLVAQSTTGLMQDWRAGLSDRRPDAWWELVRLVGRTRRESAGARFAVEGERLVVEVEGAPGAWPSDLALRVSRRLESGPARRAEGREQLARIPLAPPAVVRRGRLEGPLPATLRRQPAGEVLAVELESGGAVLASGSLATPRSPELVAPPRIRPLRAEDLPRPAPAQPHRRGPSAFGWPLLALGALALLLAGIGLGAQGASR